MLLNWKPSVGRDDASPPARASAPTRSCRRIGAGGMGEVYKARDTRLERTVAVKVLPQHLSASPEVRQRFEREAKTISQLSHPHICALYDVGREGETEYLVMEYLEGETLSDRLAKGPLPLEQTLRYGIEIADALDKAHRQGIVHRDLKPGNVMLTKSGVKLLDFGLAKAMAPAAPQSSLTSLPTQHGSDAGRHDPRDVPVHGAGAARGQGGRRADGHLRVRLRALRDGDGQEGVLGREPGVADLGDHVGASRRRSRRVQPMSPPALDRVVKTCLAKDPEDRWQSAADIGRRAALDRRGASRRGGARFRPRRASRNGNGSPGGSPPPRRSRRPWLSSEPAKATRPVDSPAPSAAPSSCRDMSTVRALALSPDGTQLALVARDASGRNLLWVRPLDSSVAAAAAGHGESVVALLVAGRPLHRFLRRRQAQAHRHLRRSLPRRSATRRSPAAERGIGTASSSSLPSPTGRSIASMPPADSRRRSRSSTRSGARAPTAGRCSCRTASAFSISSRASASREREPASTSARSTRMRRRFSCEPARTRPTRRPATSSIAANGTSCAQRLDAKIERVEGEPFALAEDIQFFPQQQSALFSASSRRRSGFAASIGHERLAAHVARSIREARSGPSDRRPTSPTRASLPTGSGGRRHRRPADREHRHLDLRHPAAACRRA